MPNFSDDFMQGQIDCQKGEPAKQDESEAYQRGYATEYTWFQIMDGRQNESIRITG